MSSCYRWKCPPPGRPLSSFLAPQVLSSSPGQSRRTLLVGYHHPSLDTCPSDHHTPHTVLNLNGFYFRCLITFYANERKRPNFLCTMLLYSSLIYIFFSHPAPPRDNETYVLSCFKLFYIKKIIQFLCHRAQLLSVISHNDQNCFHTKKKLKKLKK